MKLLVFAVVLAAVLNYAPAASAAWDWEWINPLPQGNHLRGACSFGGEFWAVGDGGAVVRFDGAAWSRIPFPWDANLLAVWGNSASNVYAVGDDPGPYTNGGIYRYNGTSWSLVKTIPYYRIYSIHGFGPGNIAAGGGGGKIYFFNGTEWIENSPGMGIYYGVNGIWGNSSADLFAAAGPYILHWDGGEWTVMTNLGSGGGAWAIWGDSADNVYAAGRQSRIYRYDGGDWALSFDGGGGWDFSALWGRSAGEVYAFGGSYPSRAYRYDGAAWEAVTAPTKLALTAAAGPGAVGVVAAGQNGQILEYGPGGWETINRFTGQEYKGVWGSSAADVYVIGSNFLSEIPEDRYANLRFDGSEWTAFTLPPASAYDYPTGSTAVWGSCADDVFIGSENGMIHHYNGAAWAFQSRLSYQAISSIWGSGAGDVFAAGMGEHPWSSIWHYDGSQWTIMTSFTDAFSVSLWGSSGSNVFAGSSYGRIFHYDGAEWSLMTQIPGVLRIWGSGLDNVYAVGSDLLVRYDGSSWSPVETGLRFKNFRAIWGSGPSDIFIVSQGVGTMGRVWGRIYHYDGASWSEVGIPCVSGLTAVWGSSGNDVYAAGDGGAILRYRGGRIPPAGGRPWIYDYDGDGTSDIAVFRPFSGLWAVRGLTRAYFGRWGDLPAPGDYNGDGSTEFAVFRPAAGLWAARGTTRAYFGNWGDWPVPADYTGDGTAEPALFRPSTGLWAIRGMTRAYFGTAGDIPAPGDYSGDGTVEIAVFRPSTGLWATRGVGRASFGRAGDIPVPAAYGGGSAEPAVFRESSGLWAVLNAPRQYFGNFPDIPAPGHYAGGETARIGIFRESSGLWAVKGLTRAYFGRVGDIPVTR